MGAFTNASSFTISGQAEQTIPGKEMNPCRRALRDLMKELLTSIPEVLLARDTPLLKAYNDAVDALAADDIWEKQMQDYMRMQQSYSPPTYISDKTISPKTWPTWIGPSTTPSGETS